MLSVIVPVRDWDPERVRACARSFLEIPRATLSQLIIVDFGSSEPLRVDNLDDRLAVVRCESPRWSLAEATNLGVMSSASEILAKTDADVLLPRLAVPEVEHYVDQIARKQVDVLLTRAIDLPSEISLRDADAGAQRGLDPKGRLRPRWGQGFLTFFTRELWARIGGYDSRLTGWGLEDNDFCDRSRRAGYRLRWIDDKRITLQHVWHPPSVHHTHVARQYDNNKEILRADRTVFKPLRIVHSDYGRKGGAAVLRRTAPHVTIAIATSDRPRRNRMIVEAVRSFHEQIDNDFEIAIIDNGSSSEAHDGLRTALRPWTDRLNIRLERREAASIPAARNQLSAEARGRFIAVMDDDDLALANRLRDHLACFEQDPLAHGSHGGWIDFDDGSGLVERNPGKERRLETLLKGTGKITCHPTSFFRTDVMRAVPYDEALTLGSDWDMALRMSALDLRVVHCGSYVILRRFHSHNVTLTGTSMQVSTGLESRAKIWSLHANAEQRRIIAEAATYDELAACANALGIGEIARLLPPYVGEWRLLLNFAALSHTEDGGNNSVFEEILAVADGELLTLEPGLSSEVVFATKSVRTVRAAAKLQRRLQEITGLAVSLISARQLEIDAKRRFDWSALQLASGELVIMSEAMFNLEDALAYISGVPSASLLAASLRIVSDSDGERRVYHVVGPKVTRSYEAMQIREHLERGGKTFRFGSSPLRTYEAYGPEVGRFH